MKRLWITRFCIKYYLAFIFVSLLGYLLIDYKSLCLFTVICIIIYISTFILGTIYGDWIPIVKPGKIKINPGKLTLYLLLLSIVAVLFGWIYLILYYGDLSSIFLNAFNVRNETIGDGIQIIPIYVTYPGALVYSAFAITLSLYHHYCEKRYLIRLIALGIVIILSDLQNFGRIGILFTIFMIAGHFVCFARKVNYRKILYSSIFLFLLLMLPRWIRGGNSLEGIGDRYSKYTTFCIPEIFAPFVALYAYYFSGIYALNELLLRDSVDFAYGQRNFASILNFANRLFADDSIKHRIAIIGDTVYVPFDTNVFTIIGEIYMDFGVIGLMILPFFFGISMGFFFKYKGIYADALKLILIAWIFYTPIYNAFSFGSFFISFVFTAALVFFADGKKYI